MLVSGTQVLISRLAVTLRDARNPIGALEVLIFMLLKDIRQLAAVFPGEETEQSSGDRHPRKAVSEGSTFS